MPWDESVTLSEEMTREFAHGGVPRLLLAVQVVSCREVGTCLIGLEWIYLAIFLFMMESADIHNYGNADDDDDNDYNDKYLSNDDDA